MAGVAVRQIKREEMRLLLDPANHHRSPLSLGPMARNGSPSPKSACAWPPSRACKHALPGSGRVRQRHKHLAPAPFMLTHIILYRRMTAREPMLVTKPFENALGRVPLLAVPAQIFLQPLIDHLGETTRFGPLDLCRPAIPGRNRKAHDLLHAVARDPEMTRVRHGARTSGASLAHPARSCRPDARDGPSDTIPR